MTKRQENRAFVEMLKEFPKVFGRVSFRERLMLRTAFTYVLEARYEDRNSIVRQLGERLNQLLKDKGDLIDNVAKLEKQIADIKANCDLAIEGRDIKIMELAEQIEQMKCCENCRWLWLKKNNETVTACSSCKDKNMWRLKK